MYFPDLSDAGFRNGSYFSQGAVYVGWLAPEEGHEFEKDHPENVSQEFLDALQWLNEPGAADSVCDQIMVFTTRGFHMCPMCESVPGQRLHTGSCHFLVSGPDRNYLVPSLIQHYVRGHLYAAPREFQDALTALYREHGDPS